MSSQIIRVPALLTELDVPAPSASLYLRRNAGDTAYEWASVTVPSTLDDLSDISITTPAAAQVLRYNGSAWVNAQLAYTDLSGLPSLVSQAYVDAGDAAVVAAFQAADAAHIAASDPHAGYALLAPGSSARNVIQGAGASVTALAVRLHASQTAGQNLVEFQNSAGTVQSGVGSGGLPWSPAYYFANPNSNSARFSYGSPVANTICTSQTTFAAVAPGASNIPLIARGAASQSANLQEWQSSAAAVLASINSAGGVTAPALLVATTAAGSVVARMRGFTSQTADLLQFQDVGATVLSSVDAAGRFLAPAGSAAAPALAFAGDTNNGAYHIGADNWALARGGSAMIELGAGGNVIKFWSPTNHVDQIRAADGSAASPGITFNSDTDTGLTRLAANYLSVATAGAERVRFTDAAIVVINPTTTPFTPEATTKQAMVLKLLASQTANALEVQSSAAAVLASVSAAGSALAQSYLLVSSGVGSWGQAGSGCAIDSWDSVTIRTTVGAAQGNIGVTGTTAFLKIAGTNRILANGTGLGFFNVTPVARPTALTAADAGALNTGDAGSDTVIGNMRTRINELETKLQSLGLLT